MRFPTTDTVNKRIAENQRASQKTRLRALAAIQRPTRTLLFRLISNPLTPSKLLSKAAELYEIAILKVELKNNANRQTKDTPANS